MSAFTGPRVGIVCSNGPTFDMTTDTDYISLPDGNTVYMYGYKLVGTPFQHPSPVLCVNQGDTVTIKLTNTLQRDISMIFPGQNDVLANGAAVTPQFSTRRLTTLTSLTPGRGRQRRHGDVHASSPTTPARSCTSRAPIPTSQVRMGLFGALIVRPTHGRRLRLQPVRRTGSRSRARQPEDYGGANNAEEFMVLLSEIDPYLNQAIERKDSGLTLELQPRQLPPPLLAGERSWLPRLDRRQRGHLAAQPALRRARPGA